MENIYNLLTKIIQILLGNGVIVTEDVTNTVTDGILEVCINVQDNCPRGTARRLERTKALNAELSGKVKALSAPI